MKKEDFKNPVDWVIYKVTGRTPEQPKKEDSGVRFYMNNKGRYAVWYNSQYICMCDEYHKDEVEDYITSHNDNLAETANHLRRKYNKQFHSYAVNEDGQTRLKVGRKRKSYRENRLQFEDKPSGRTQIRVHDNGKSHSICNCYTTEKDIVQRDWDELKGKYDLESLKLIMRNRYNIKKTRKKSSVKTRNSYRENTVTFVERENGRWQVNVNDYRTLHHLCNCNTDQKEEVRNKYNELKGTHDIGEIKTMMKGKYNKIRRQHRTITVNDGGMVYVDGDFIKVDNELYSNLLERVL